MTRYTWVVPELQASRFKVDATHWNEIIENVRYLKDRYDDLSNFFQLSPDGAIETQLSTGSTTLAWNTSVDDNSILVSTTGAPDYTFTIGAGDYEVEATFAASAEDDAALVAQLYNYTDTEIIMESTLVKVTSSDINDNNGATLIMRGSFTLLAEKELQLLGVTTSSGTANYIGINNATLGSFTAADHNRGFRFECRKVT